jgi:uracil-xanthine permease
VALWTMHGDGRLRVGEAVRPDERLSWPMTVGFGMQHFVAMFGAAVTVPALTGLPVSTTLLFSGAGTLLFLIFTRNRVPAYLGPSYAFVAPLVVARAQGVPAQLGALLLSGVLLAVIGIAVKALGIRLLDSVMPPVVTGGVIVLLGLNLAPYAAKTATTQPVFALITVVLTGLCAVLFRGPLARVAVLLGVLAGWAAAAASGLLDAGRLNAVANASWIGLPTFQQPELRPGVFVVALPAVLVLVAQNVGHVKAISTLTGRDLDGNVGDVLIGAGFATALAGAGGGSATTTYAENIGVMAATRVYSTAAYVVTAGLAIALSFSPKITAVVATIPDGVVGGVTLVLCGLVAMIGLRVWQDNKIDLTDPLNLVVAGTAIAAGIGNFTIVIGPMRFTGIVLGSALIVLGYPILRRLRGLRR